MKKILNLLLIVCIILTLSTNVFAKTTVVNTSVNYNGKPLKFEKPVLNIDGSTYFPMRELLNNLGVSNDNINWDGDTKSVAIYANNTITLFVIDSNEMVENGVPSTITTKPVIYNGSAYLPVRPVAKACGIKVGYDEKTRTINLTK